MTGDEEGHHAGPEDDLRRTVGLLLSTQQALIDLRHRRDRELRVLDGIVRFSGRTLPGDAGAGFWEAVADAATETFECEACLVAETRGTALEVLALRGPSLRGEAEGAALRALVERGLAEGGLFLEGGQAAAASLAGEPLALVMVAPLRAGPGGPQRALVAAVSARKRVFFPQFDALTLPGLRMFASHVHAVFEMLRSRQLIAGQLRELDRSHHALATANASLEQRIAEQQRAEEALRESEARYRQLFEDSADGMALVDGSSGWLEDCNTALCRMTGFRREDLLAQAAPDLLRGPGPASGAAVAAGTPAAGAASAALGAPHREGAVLVLEGELRTARGAGLPVEVRVSRLQVQGRDLRLCVVHDVSYRRQAEAEQERLRGQLAQSQKMESIGRLAGGVAHDFNNLLTVITGYGEILHGDAGLTPRLHEMVGGILEAGRRARALTQQLLMFSRKQVIRPVGLDMNQQVEASLRMYRRLLGEDITLAFEPCREPTPILADAQQLDQVLGNLLINARDAIYACQPRGPESRIRIHTALVRGAPGLSAGDEFVRLVVQDTGIGMDPETLAHLFEPFFTTKEVGEGTGLGLATVFGVLQQNHGAIEVASEPGRGATITAYWPVDRSAVPAAAVPVPEPVPVVAAPPAPSLAPTPAAVPGVAGVAAGTSLSPARGGRVLLVEDDEAVRDYEVQCLRRQGYDVLAATSGPEALRLLESGSACPDILITDVVMPEMNGRDLAERARCLRPGLPVLFVSGYTDDIVAQHGVVREGVALLEKPFSIDELTGKIRSLLEAAAART